MSPEESLKQLNLRKYASLIAIGSGVQAGLGIYADNSLVAKAGAWDEIVATSNDEPIRGSSQRVTLLDYQFTPIAELHLMLPESERSAFASADSGLSVGFFEAIANCVQEELSLATELLEMTDELTSRYEELNLVFSNQERGDLPDGIDRQLKDIVESSSQYMQLSMCFMVLRNQDKSFFSTKQPELRVLEPAIGNLAKPVTRWLETHQGSHVFNNGLEFTLNIPEDYREWRHILTPITIGTSDNVAGFIVVARPPDREFFTNSDKNLLEVMAQKASKLIRSTYDDLTRLLRRTAFQTQLETQLSAPHDDREKLALMLINVDRMQVINEAHSHDAGNELLKWVARHLEESKHASDIIGRFGGDQFLVLLRRNKEQKLEKTARSILKLINDSEFSWRGGDLEVTVSAGLALIQDSTRHAGQALAEAEFACSAAKELGGGKLEIFASGDALLLERHAQLNQVSVMQNALKENDFVLYAQPIRPLVDPSREPHAEVLIRLRDSDGQIIPPGLFLPAAERFNMMPSIDRWVIEHALEAVHAVSSELQLQQHVLTINLSGQALSDSGFIHFLRDILASYKPRPGSICFEVTETTAIRDMQLAREFMTDLRNQGVTFALDDFGTGLSSFSYLQQLPLDTLKIDGSFVREIVNDDVARTMVKAINDVGQSMGLTTIAEFVSNAEIEASLISMGVDYGQGFSLAKPMPLEDYLQSLCGNSSAKIA